MIKNLKQQWKTEKKKVIFKKKIMKEKKGYLDMELLRFTTAGSVDDGKSTLIGRLLYDSKSIFEDQMSILEETSKQRGEDGINLALLTDGLRSEREQGITIDVAYRYFATPKRKIYYCRYSWTHSVYKKYGDRCLNSKFSHFTY